MIQNETRQELVNFLMDELSYCYCDSCKYAEEEFWNESNCEYCHRKYSNWSLGKTTAEMLVDKITEVIDNAE